MTRVAIWALGTRGDVIPYRELADGLARAGTDPLLVTSDDQYDLARASGHEAVSVGSDPSALLTNRHPHALGGADGALAQLHATADYLRDARSVYRAIARRAVSDLSRGISAHIVTFASVWLYPFLASVVGRDRVAGAFLQPVTFSTRYRSTVLPSDGPFRLVPPLLSHRAADLATWLPWRSALSPVARRRGLDLPVAGPVHLLHRHEATIVYGFSEALVPAALVARPNHHLTGRWDVTGQRIDRRTSPEDALHPSIARLCAEHGAPVLVSFGSQSRSYRRILTGLVEHRNPRVPMIVQGHGAIAPSTRPASDEVVFLPDEHLDHDLTLSRCRGMIHHGGAGTLHTATAHGVPSIVIPLSSDTHFWRDRAVAAGVAPPNRVGARARIADLEQAIIQLARPAYAHRAAELAQVMTGEPGPDRAARLLLEAVGR